MVNITDVHNAVDDDDDYDGDLDNVADYYRILSDWQATQVNNTR